MLDKKSNSIYIESTARCKFFQSSRVWPLLEELNWKGFLSNFDNEKDLEIACQILDFFCYYPKKMVDQMLRTSVGRAGYELSKHYSDWNHTDFKSRCIYSFIPGETLNASDSGYLFIRKLRDTLGIPESQFKNYVELHDLLESGSNYPVIFVDDFVGSGAQCIKAWIQNKAGKSLRTLQEISITNNHKIVYAPLLVNDVGYKRIKQYCNGLILSPSHIIGEEYNLFNPKCICWKNDINLYNAGVELISRKSRELGIPSSGVTSEKGFGGQGLAIAFEHGAPDAIPAFFYWCSINWIPLIPKVYKR